MKKIGSKVFGALLTLLLWYLQEIPQKSDSWYDNFLREHKYELALGSLVLCICAYIFEEIYDYIRKRCSVKRWTDSFLKHIIKEHLSGRNFQTRITILKPMKGYEIIFQYIFIYPIKAFFLKHYKVCHKGFWNNIPYKLFDDYLSIYARYGHSDTHTSYTHFLITDRNEPFNGIADKCFKEEMEQEVCTVRISETALPPKYGLTNSAVKKYMKESFIDRKYYCTLLSMNTKANNLYAIPIFMENQRIWGVMIIDNDSNQKISYKEKLDSHIAMYQKIFAYTLQILK